MTRHYCSCYRGGDYSNRTAVIPDDNGLDICCNCGGIVPPDKGYPYEPPMNPDMLRHKNRNSFDPYDECCQNAKACSIKEDHSAAIELYKQAWAMASQDRPKCNALSLIAGEYESLGDYDSAEEYWNRCLAVERASPINAPEYIAGKGDFLYRIWRHEEAVDTYEEALKSLEVTGNREIDLFYLGYYARVVHFIISSYLLLGNNLEEEYHNRLKHQIDAYMRSERLDDERKAHSLSRTAWRLYENDHITDEALILIDAAINLHPTSEDYKRKAILIKSGLEISVSAGTIRPPDLDRINEALKILPEDCDSGPFLKTKGDILGLLGDPVKAKICYALSAKDYDKVDEAERQLKKLKPHGTYINITGIEHYQNFEPFREGTIVDLIKEPDNQYDPYAIRVEINGETVGYVANSRYTLIKEVKSAADIKNRKSTQAKVQFILFGQWVIAKLI